jgi:hypothetical protein
MSPTLRTMIEKSIILALLALACAAVIVMMATTVFAHSVILEDGTSFTFDQYCCNGRDCEEVPLSAIKQVGAGWTVDYVSAKTGRRIRGFFKEGAVGQKWSPNHQVFACQSLMMNKDGTFVPRCIYPQKPGM